MLPGSWIEDYLALYPKVAVEAEYTSCELDLVHEGFDLAIRSGPMADEAVTQSLLEPVLGPWAPAPVAVHAVYASNRYLTPKVRAFIDLALERFQQPRQPAPPNAVAAPRGDHSRRRRR